MRTDAQNHRLFEKLARKLVEDGTDAEEIFDCFKDIYELGKTMGGAESDDRAIERSSASFARISRQLVGDFGRHE